MAARGWMPPMLPSIRAGTLIYRNTQQGRQQESQHRGNCVHSATHAGTTARPPARPQLGLLLLGATPAQLIRRRCR